MSFFQPMPGLPHPWNDPLAMPPPDVDRPEWAMPYAPDPRDFPFNEQGRREYYRQASLAAYQHYALLHARHVASGARPEPGPADYSVFLLLLS